MGDTDDLIRRANDLEERIEQRKTVIDDLLSYAKSNRRVARVALALAVVLAGVVIVLVVTVIKVQNTALTAQRNSVGLAHIEDVTEAVASNLRETCEADNVNKAKEAELWRQIFALPASPDLTQAQKDQAATIEAFVATVYAPDDCTVEAP